jgi:hypothetical protein
LIVSGFLTSPNDQLLAKVLTLRELATGERQVTAQKGPLFRLFSGDAADTLGS